MNFDYKKKMAEELSFYDMSWKARILRKESYFIGQYLKNLRKYEYYRSNGSFIGKIIGLCSYFRYRHYGYKLGFQIKPGTCDFNLKIYHYGTIIVNAGARLGKNCTIYPGVTIGQKEKGEVPVIGDNCFIGLGAMVFGAVCIGDNVVVAPNSVVVKNVESGCVVGGSPAKVIK